QEAIDRLSSRVRAERPLALATGDWSDGYVGDFNAGRFRIRPATNIPRLYAVQAYGSVRDDADGSVMSVKFRRNGVANAIVWFARILFAVLITLQLIAGLRQPLFLTGAVCLAGVGGAVRRNARGARGYAPSC